MKTIISICIACLIMVTAKAYADNYHHNNYTTPAPTSTTYVTEVTELTNITDVVNTYNNYTLDECQSTAIAMATGNNQMYMGTDKPQLSLGVGECSGDLASSLMFGMRINKSMMLNGNWATDNSINAFGAGITVLFK